MSFRTGIHGASLNKTSPFRLRQFILEAGLRIQKSERVVINNEPPDELTDIGIPTVDLRTAMFRVLARK